MRYILAVLAVLALFLFSGCISPTPSMRMNGAAITDVAKDIYTRGCAPGDPRAAQLVKMAVTNEQILGSPEKRLDITNLEGLEANRVQAETDAAAGGFWPAVGATALGVLGVAASWFGLSSVASWAGKKKKQLAEVTRQALDAEEAAREYARHFTTAVQGIKTVKEQLPEAAEKIDGAMRAKARDAGDKPAYDAAVRAALA